MRKIIEVIGFLICLFSCIILFQNAEAGIAIMVIGVLMTIVGDDDLFGNRGN